VQGTAEGEPFDRPTLDRMLDLAEGGIRRLFDAQRDALERA
jgi:ribonuclease PH